MQNLYFTENTNTLVDRNNLLFSKIEIKGIYLFFFFEIIDHHFFILFRWDFFYSTAATVVAEQ